jgi:predicted DNA-binding protein
LRQKLFSTPRAPVVGVENTFCRKNCSQLRQLLRPYVLKAAIQKQYRKELRPYVLKAAIEKQYRKELRPYVLKAAIEKQYIKELRHYVFNGGNTKTIQKGASQLQSSELRTLFAAKTVLNSQGSR